MSVYINCHVAKVSRLKPDPNAINRSQVIDRSPHITVTFYPSFPVINLKKYCENYCTHKSECDAMPQMYRSYGSIEIYNQEE